ncbi:hypothetical protein BV25DRAFT_168251 [Artomyces pyxidatus]|uniref:Uncharacterized protein n=1 Tax=Artomyces pyxidatus TaxID=48021 RepID=A0ACB8SIK6_9AGAM|nr:hypothetical protein BV25DRAFT_168251 [Artomyces pyxidatus]
MEKKLRPRWQSIVGYESPSRQVSSVAHEDCMWWVIHEDGAQRYSAAHFASREFYPDHRGPKATHAARYRAWDSYFRGLRGVVGAGSIGEIDDSGDNTKRRESTRWRNSYHAKSRFPVLNAPFTGREDPQAFQSPSHVWFSVSSNLCQDRLSCDKGHRQAQRVRVVWGGEVPCDGEAGGR